MTFPKPARRAPKAKRGIARARRPRQVSMRPSAVKRRLADQQWVVAVRNNAHYFCELCSWAGTVEAGYDCHHVFGKKAHPALRHSIPNGVFLSRRCHRWAHAHPVLFREAFKEHRPASWAALMAAK